VCVINFVSMLYKQKIIEATTEY